MSMTASIAKHARLKLLVSAAIWSSSAPAQNPSPAWGTVDKALGRTGTTQPDGVRRYSFPRSDLKVQLDGTRIRPALALGSWVAFQPMNGQTMIMGDLVLTHDEVNPVLSELLAGGLTITALHNHLLRSSPSTMYMHVRGHGDPSKLAATLRTALAKSRTPMAQPASTPAGQLHLDTAVLDGIIGAQGKASGGVYQFVIPRPEKLTDGNRPTPASMGTGTVLNFQPVGGGQAAITGDFVLLADEVDPVLRALRAARIEVTALHNHMLDDQPRLFFMHFWARDDAQRLGRGLRSALNATRRDQAR